MKFNLKLLQSKIGKNLEFFFVLLLILISVAITQIYNISRDISKKKYVGVINNLYFQKTVNNILDNLQPKYRNIEHKVAKNETLSSIFKNYDVAEKETNLILKKLREKNKKISTLKVNQIIKFTINESNKKVSTVIYPISKTKKIELIRNAENDSFTRREIITNLKKRIIFKEAKILQSLYKSAVNQSIPANVIVEFARIYGFQVDFQRDIRRNDTFQIIYETFEDENKKVFTTGNILYADLNLSNQSNSFYYFDLKDEEGHYDLNGKSVKKAL